MTKIGATYKTGQFTDSERNTLQYSANKKDRQMLWLFFENPDKTYGASDFHYFFAAKKKRPRIKRLTRNAFSELARFVGSGNTYRRGLDTLKNLGLIEAVGTQKSLFEKTETTYKFCNTRSNRSYVLEISNGLK